MRKIWQKIKAIPLIAKLNKNEFMPIIWWGLLSAITPYILSLIKLPIVWRVGLFYLILYSILSYFLGKFIQTHHLSKWWLLFLPAIFDLAIIIKFANYNLFFGLIYLIFEVFGILGNRLYR